MCPTPRFVIMSDMEAQIRDIATSASQVLLNPFLLTVPVVGVLALVTGFASRIALFVEDFVYDRTLARRTLRRSKQNR